MVLIDVLLLYYLQIVSSDLILIGGFSIVLMGDPFSDP